MRLSNISYFLNSNDFIAFNDGMVEIYDDNGHSLKVPKISTSKAVEMLNLIEIF